MAGFQYNWAPCNPGVLLCAFLKIDKEPKVTSFMLTSELIPVTYLKAEALPLPIVSFQNLKKQGIELLES